MAGKKRKNPDSHEEEIYSNKSRSRPSVEPKLDPTYGQKGAIPGLDDDTLYEEEDGYMYDEDMNAMAYLRSVRQEASAIPNLLVAPKIQTLDHAYELYNNGVGDFRGRYEDGAYLAEADEMSEDQQNDTGEEDPQTLYFNSIILRYQKLCTWMSQVPPRDVLQALGPDNAIHVGPLNKMLSRDWIRRMQNSDPKPAQIASMNKGSVLRLLRLLTQGTTLRRGSQVDLGMTYWVWSLLARLPDRGELNSEEIGVVRELGKKAVLIGMGLKEVEGWQKGIQDVGAQFEEDLKDNASPVINDEEIDLDVDDDDEEYAGPIVNLDQKESSSRTTNSLRPESSTSNLDADSDQPVSASSQRLTEDVQSAVTAENQQDTEDNESHDNDGDSEEAQSLAAMKARALGRLNPHSNNINMEPEISVDPKPRPSPSLSNTRATVDMIITIAGEMYGQRDLLEFRSEWAHIM